MRRLALCLTLLASLSGAAWADARHDIDAYYADHVKVPPYVHEVRLLKSPRPAERQQAAEYLTRMLQLLYEDEKSGQTPIRQSPFFGASAEADAHELRLDVAGYLGAYGSGREALDAATFLLQVDSDSQNQAAGIHLLNHIEGDDANGLLRSVLDPPCPDQTVLVGALNIVRTRHLTVDARFVVPLCAHYRSRVRKEAERTAASLGLKDLPSWNPHVIPGPIADQLDSIATMLPPLEGQAPGATAAGLSNGQWVHVRYCVGYSNAPVMAETYGWLLDKKPGQYHIVDAFGVEQRLDATHGSWTPMTLLQEAAFLEKVRLERHGEDLNAVLNQFLSPWRGMSTGGYDPPTVAAPEALVALWLRQQGHEREAADLLMPRIDQLEDDRWLKREVQMTIGNEVHQSMLNAFCVRDYALATVLAHHLGGAAFDGYPYQGRAQELERQLATRQDDFKKLTLPTSHAWALAQKSLARQQQIDYLVARLHLMSAWQSGQPGGISFGEEQYATLKRETFVINPAQALIAMHLSHAELSRLVPELADENYILAFSFFRDFMPERDLHRVNEVVAAVINESAGHDVVDLNNYYRLGPKERTAWLEHKAQALKSLNATRAGTSEAQR